MRNFSPIHPSELLKRTTVRAGEEKWGQKMVCWEAGTDWNDYPQPFVLIAIAEDIGVRANFGRPGCASAFYFALDALCNFQEAGFSVAENLLLGGLYQNPKLMEEAEKLDPQQAEDLERLRQMVAQIDEEVYVVLLEIFRAGKIPVVIGGGHNNAYPILRAAANAFGQSVHALNMDPHADLRALEGRHSGNGFHYALENGYLDRYHLWGYEALHNNRAIAQLFAEHPELQYTSYRHIRASENPQQLLKNACNTLLDKPCGLELDCDSIHQFPCSAKNTAGFNLQEVRSHVLMASALLHPIYLHLCEAAPILAESEAERSSAAKAIAYLLSDFMIHHQLWKS